ncbi:hypothetical protein E2C01_045499 [Portunus trituberculatus]|uniref:Uncharacterized protein n=1 Tax=Portunus trituberculatus TaxID=210409 RepID=A0A5B7G271_PORTR|nr:hypothetical protein [Portunus trituberculatus]
MIVCFAQVTLELSNAIIYLKRWCHGDQVVQYLAGYRSHNTAGGGEAVGWPVLVRLYILTPRTTPLLLMKAPGLCLAVCTAAPCCSPLFVHLSALFSSTRSVIACFLRAS